MTPTLKKLPEDIHREKMMELIKKYVLNEYVTLSLSGPLRVDENVGSEKSIIEGTLVGHYEDHKKIIPLRGEGIGVLHAFHNGIKTRLENRYSFAEDLEMEELRVDTIHPKTRGAISQDKVAVTILVRVGSRKRIAFRHQSSSVLASLLGGFLQACEYFINTERAIKKVVFLMENYKKRGRPGLLEECLTDLTYLVEYSYYKPEQSI